MVVIWIAVAIVVAVFLHRTVAGRKLFATGANPRAARLDQPRQPLSAADQQQ